MTTNMPSLRHFGLPHQKRFPFLAFALVITLGGAIVWVLSILGAIQAAWSSLIGVFFAVFGVMLALLPYIGSSASMQITSTPITPMSSSTPVTEYTSPAIIEQRGTLQIKTHRKLRGITVYLVRGFDLVNIPPAMALPVREQRMRYGRIGVIRFPPLEPGNYTVYTSSRKYITKVTIFAGFETEIDWR